MHLFAQDGAAGAAERSRPNRIDPSRLNEVDQRMLKEAFRQARKLQQRLKDTYAVAL